jgi:hypothetical protein
MTTYSAGLPARIHLHAARLAWVGLRETFRQPPVARAEADSDRAEIEQHQPHAGIAGTPNTTEGTASMRTRSDLARRLADIERRHLVPLRIVAVSDRAEADRVRATATTDNLRIVITGVPRAAEGALYETET